MPSPVDDLQSDGWLIGVEDVVLQHPLIGRMDHKDDFADQHVGVECLQAVPKDRPASERQIGFRRVGPHAQAATGGQQHDADVAVTHDPSSHVHPDGCRTKIP